MDNEENITKEIDVLRKVNSRNNKIIIALLVVLVFVSIIAIYVRFFS
ncbi:MAG: hypothetical protein K2J20_05820 [Bacilli bacterium]|nr:hypothetical protein [Bacilli bacterium]